MEAKKGDWVRIRSVILPAQERTGALPEDTRATDMLMWTKGFLLDDSAGIGDEVRVETYIGRIQTGVLTEISPYYRHDYGKSVPELLPIGRQLRRALKEEEAGGRDER